MVAYSFQRRFAEPIRVGLSSVSLSFDRWPKRQTIRAMGKRRHASPGEIVQLYTGMRTRNCELLGEGRCVGFGGVLLKWSEWPSYCLFDLFEHAPREFRRVGPLRPIADMDQFARDDGFNDFDDMKAFWFDTHGATTFEGVVIKWEPL
ncbi:hypothetical protein [Azospirillum sp.]|uniref:hypothetical protein n=1 Tax=Azospirillum sp. TaxID=34012 RepID=UPI002D4930B4|nr:hypothetical protein [Azospirillum sp.]HYD66120.1 hypothetical protein [Azospirillum sp.]